MAKQSNQKEDVAPLCLSEKLTRIAEFQFPLYDWRTEYGSGIFPGDRYNEGATRTILPNYTDPVVLMQLVMTLDVSSRIEYANIIYRKVHGHDVTPEDDGAAIPECDPSIRLDAFLEVIGKK